MKYINEEKIRKINFDTKNFFVAIDFDKTITARKNYDSWIASAILLGDDFNTESNLLVQKYEPIELDYKIEFEEKNKAMEEWYYSSLALYYKYNLTLEQLNKSIDSSNLCFRNGAKHFLKYMHELDVPVIILSAGIGNVIERFLKNNECLYDNIFIISNFIPFDENGNIEKYNGELIHTLNKKMEGNLPVELEKKLNEKEYCILLGDVIEDKNMISKNRLDKALTIGFLDKMVEENLESFKMNFDLVFTNEDASFENIWQYIKIN